MTEVWYSKPECFSDAISGDLLPDSTSLQATHVLLGEVEWNDPEEVFEHLNLDSPHPFAQKCREQQIHTSMSIGDVLVTNGKTLLCGVVGFEEI